MRIAFAAIMLASPAAAEVKSSGPTGFELENRRMVAADPAAVWAMLGRIGEWWEPSHTYSGDAANLSIALRAGGCFCEAVPDGGSVEHMRIVQARPGALLRMQGGLGPLQGEAVSGTLDWSLKAAPGGTEIVQSYRVAGAIRGGAEGFAGPVDGVLAAQLARLADRLGDKAGE